MKHSTTAVIALALVTIVAPSAGAQSSGRRSTAESEVGSNLRMGDTAILGERQTPDAFFIIPRGLGTGPKVAHRRDYSSDIQEPVVKTWLERSTSIASIATPRSSGESIDWQARLGGPAPERAIAEPEEAPREEAAYDQELFGSDRYRSRDVARPEIPAEARSASPPADSSMPSEARSLPSESRSSSETRTASPFLTSVPPPLPPPREPAPPAPGFERQTSADGVPLLVPVQ